ncbi:uncharacterized protein [Pyrus communis]|uniref:uncharacterized protein n=1 Tax=Pyrus communis TaxID=23211 RepID=UPI0035C231BF
MPRYLQGNRQAEVSNKTIIDCLKKTLLDKMAKWPDEVSSVLWAYRTTKKQATGETPFSLVYGYKVIIPSKALMPSITTVLPNFKQNEKKMATNLDLAEEEREKVITRIAAYQQQLLSNYNKREKIRQF